MRKGFVLCILTFLFFTLLLECAFYGERLIAEFRYTEKVETLAISEISTYDPNDREGIFLTFRYRDTESGNEYLINTFTDGSGANIKNKETGEILYSSDAVSEERDHMRNTWDINTALLMSKGMPEDNAEDIADAVKRAAPDEVIGRIEGYDPDTEDIEIKVTMETGKVFYITAKEEDDWKVRLSYEDEL